MRAYRLSNVEGKVELGPAEPGRLDEWLAGVDASAADTDYSTFGLYRDEEDFIELGAIGKGRFLLHSDRLGRAAGWLRALFQKPHLERALSSRAQALVCAQDYLALTRERFEDKYG
jgi:hypothetical protein